MCQDSGWNLRENSGAVLALYLLNDGAGGIRLFGHLVSPCRTCGLVLLGLACFLPAIIADLLAGMRTQWVASVEREAFTISSFWLFYLRKRLAPEPISDGKTRAASGSHPSIVLIYSTSTGIASIISNNFLNLVETTCGQFSALCGL
jgi:hypothetical protein